MLFGAEKKKEERGGGERGRERARGLTRAGTVLLPAVVGEGSRAQQLRTPHADGFYFLVAFPSTQTDVCPQVMRRLLQTTDRIVQEIDSVEYGLTDIQVNQATEILLAPY